MNVLELPIVLQRKFDLILLSNIGDYVPEMGKNLETRLQFLRDKMGILLGANGAVISTTFSRAPKNYYEKDWEVERITESFATIKVFKRK